MFHGLPNRGDLARTRWDCRDRLRLVYRVSLLHGSVSPTERATSTGASPNLLAEDVNPDMHILGNKPRTRGVVEKCSFCIQRVRKGRLPACHEACPVGARKFGNLLDPESEIRYLLDHKRTFVLKAELETHPKFFYFWGTEGRD